MKKRILLVTIVSCLLVFLAYVLIVNAVGYFISSAGSHYADHIILNAAINGSAASDYFGYSVASGDVNNDGYADVIVGADASNGYDGQVFVFFGTTNGIPETDVLNANITINGTVADIYFGVSVASGDVNNDSYADIIVGAAEPIGTDSTDNGQVFVFFGANFTSLINENALGYYNITINGTTRLGLNPFGAHLGNSVASGDVNNDGYDDIIAGAYRASDGGNLLGQVYVFFGADFTEKINPTLNATDYANITVNGTNSGDYFGYSVASGDVNNDGYADVIAGANYEPYGGAEAWGYQGRVYVFFGADFTEKINPISNAPGYANITINGTAYQEFFGYSVASGDVNNDSYADVIIGSYGGAGPLAVSSSGQVHVFFGADFIEKLGPNLDASEYANITINGTEGSHLGVSVTSGDVNNDNYSDVIAGANMVDSRGQAYVFFGADFTEEINPASDALGYANITLNGTSANQQVGQSVTSSDIDNDSYDDVIVGDNMADLYDTEGNTIEDAGQIFVYFYDDTIPSLTIVSPLNNTGDTDGLIYFNYTMVDSQGVDSCWLTINDNINITNTTSEIPENFTITLTQGAYTWSINCNDTSNNVLNSDTYDLNVNLATEFSGDSTDLSRVNISNITNLILDVPSDGKINFTEDISLNGSSDLDSYVNISFNRIEINSTELSELNHSAILYLYNLTFSNPRILRDDTVCPSDLCEELSYSGGVFEFNVTGFSVYTTEETPTATSESVGGGSSSTGQGGYAPVDASEGIVRTMSIEDAIIISLGEFGGGSAGGKAGHQIVLDSMDSNSVNLLIYSTPINVVLEINESKKVDVDNDSILDILIKLNSIDLPHQKAEIYFEDITPKKEIVPAEEVGEEEVVEEKPEAPPEEAPVVPEETPSKAWLWVLIIIILVVICVGYYFVKKNRINSFLKLLKKLLNKKSRI